MRCNKFISYWIVGWAQNQISNLIPVKPCYVRLSTIQYFSSQWKHFDIQLICTMASSREEKVQRKWIIKELPFEIQSVWRLVPCPTLDQCIYYTNIGACGRSTPSSNDRSVVSQILIIKTTHNLQEQWLQGGKQGRN